MLNQTHAHNKKVHIQHKTEVKLNQWNKSTEEEETETEKKE